MVNRFNSTLSFRQPPALPGVFCTLGQFNVVISLREMKFRSRSERTTLISLKPTHYCRTRVWDAGDLVR